VIRRPILILAAALAVVASGCGGGDEPSEPEGTPPRQWVTSVCGALDRWQTSLEAKAKGVPQEVLQAFRDGPTEAKQLLSNLLGEVIAETDAMIRRVDAAGQPAVEQGRRIAADVHARLLRVKTALQDARKSVERVPTDNPLEFQRQMADIAPDLLAQERALKNILSGVDAKPLRDAIQETERCAAFTGN
jgi:hypothetical protein